MGKLEDMDMETAVFFLVPSILAYKECSPRAQELIKIICEFFVNSEVYGTSEDLRAAYVRELKQVLLLKTEEAAKEAGMRILMAAGQRVKELLTGDARDR